MAGGKKHRALTQPSQRPRWENEQFEGTWGQTGMDLDIFTSPGFYQDGTFFNPAFLHSLCSQIFQRESLSRGLLFTWLTQNGGLLDWNSRPALLLDSSVLCSMRPKPEPHQALVPQILPPAPCSRHKAPSGLDSFLSSAQPAPTPQVVQAGVA